MPKSIAGGLAAACLALAALPVSASADDTGADAAQIARGGYLVSFSGCNDCHTPGYFLGNPDMANFLAGSDVGFEIPGAGVFVGPNITPDEETGIGSWSDAEIIAALTTGMRPDGRQLVPIMPWHALANLTEEDVQAVVAYLRSIDPVRRQTPGPFKPGETVNTLMFRIMPPGTTAADGK